MMVTDYLTGPESLRRRELVWGIVREPAAPFYSHQRLVTDLTVLLQGHVRRYGLGEVVVSPIDIVLDEARGLVLQPDIVFLSKERLGLVRSQIWGAPDLVVEVLSLGSSAYDRKDKLAWYRRYGVREYWIVDPIALEIIVHVFGRRRVRTTTFGPRRPVRSAVLRNLRLPVARLFGPRRAAS